MLIFLEGIDGSGKSSVAKELQSRYFNDAKMLKLPTDRLRESLPDKKSMVSTAYSFMADTAEVLSLEVMPALAEGKDVIVDRSWLSTIVYQGEYMRKFIIEESVLKSFEHSVSTSAYIAFCEGVATIPKDIDYPEAFIFILRPDVQEALDRVKARNKENGVDADKYEDVNLDVWNYRNSEYLRLASDEGVSIPKIAIDTRGLSVKKIAAKIYDEVMGYARFTEAAEAEGLVAATPAEYADEESPETNNQ